MVTNLIRAPLLVLLSDVEGLYTGHPDDPKSQLIETVSELDEATMALASDGPAKGKGDLGTGGMASKLQAARIATAAGENVIIASGQRAGVLTDIFEGRQVGTLILAEGRTVKSRKRWIGFAARSCGHLILDDGAVRAIRKQGRSLLAIGVLEVSGRFNKGDVIELRTSDGSAIARGLTNYHADEIRQLAGRRSDQFAKILGHCPYKELVHRDNLVVA